MLIASLYSPVDRHTLLDDLHIAVPVEPAATAVPHLPSTADKLPVPELKAELLSPAHKAALSLPVVIATLTDPSVLEAPCVPKLIEKLSSFFANDKLFAVHAYSYTALMFDRRQSPVSPVNRRYLPDSYLLRHS